MQRSAHYETEQKKMEHIGDELATGKKEPCIIFVFNLHSIGFPNGAEMEARLTGTLYHLRIPPSFL